MTHEQYIELETAKLAKQAGFDWEIDACYSRFQAELSLIEHDYNGNFNNTTEYICDKNSDWDWYSAPTQAVLQRWLREVHNMIIRVDYSPANEYSDIDVYDSVVYTKWNQLVPVVGEYLTYESALEAGLKKCLTLIIEKQ